MKWQPLAQQVLLRLKQNTVLTDDEFSSLADIVKQGRGVSAFIETQRICHSRGIPVGWNKIWRENTLKFWAGDRIVTQPLRITAFEINDIAGQVQNLSRFISGLIEAEINADEEYQAEIRLLNSFGMAIDPTGDRRLYLKLLQRLNLDSYIHPFIDRWKWSRQAGYAVTTDDDHIQVSTDLVWFRAIERVLTQEGQLPQGLVQVLRQIDPDAVESEIDQSLMTKIPESFQQAFRFYDFARFHFSGIRFWVKPGRSLELIKNLYLVDHCCPN